jgi:hypothetical protein
MTDADDGDADDGPREFREAALVIGRSATQIRADLPTASEVFATPRGTVVLDAEGLDYASDPEVTIYEVIRYLDTGELRCAILRGEDAAVFRHPPGGPSFGLDVLDSIDGETEPRNIVRALGIPERFMFP